MIRLAPKVWITNGAEPRAVYKNLVEVGDFVYGTTKESEYFVRSGVIVHVTDKLIDIKDEIPETLYYATITSESESNANSSDIRDNPFIREAFIGAYERGAFNEAFPFNAGLAKLLNSIYKMAVEQAIQFNKEMLFVTALLELKAKYISVPQDVWDKLSRHDWYYGYSDDIAVYRGGKESEQVIKELLSSHDASPLFEEYIKLRF